MRKEILVAALGTLWFTASGAQDGNDTRAAQDGDDTRSGAELFANHCASCHGGLGEGDGPVAAVMRVTMPNLRTLSQRNDGTFPAEAVQSYIDGRAVPAAHGDRYMPVWGDVFGWGAENDEFAEERVDRRIDAIIEYLRELQYE